MWILSSIRQEGQTLGCYPLRSKCYGFPDTVRANYQNAGFLTDLEFALEQKLQNVYYLGPLTSLSATGLCLVRRATARIWVRQGEAVVDALLAARQQDLKISPGYKKRRLTLEQYVAQWLKETWLDSWISCRAVSLRAAAMFEVRVRKSPQGADVLITDVGFGVSQILPELVLCFYVPDRIYGDSGAAGDPPAPERAG